jgi:hypothetical protein
MLRYLERVHDGLVVYLSLAPDLSSIGEDLPRGFLAVDAEIAEERRIVGKAVSLAAVNMAIQATDRGVSVSPDLLIPALPDRLIRRPRALTPRVLGRILQTVEREPLETFSPLASGHVLQQFAAGLGRTANEQAHGPMLVLLDRCDMVVPACLAAVFQLLDQDDAYTAIAAMRPGPSPPPALTDHPIRAAAGDHFDVLTLGGRPRSPQWRAFVRASLEQQPQLGPVLKSLSRSTIDGVIRLARDSVKVAVDVLGRASGYPEPEQEGAVVDALEDVASSLAVSTRGVLRQFHPDVGGLLRQFRADAVTTAMRPSYPFVVAVDKPGQGSLLETTTDTDRLIAVGLRCGAFCLPEGAGWAPGDRPQEVEVCPLLLWRREDGLASTTGAQVRVKKAPRELLGRRGRAHVVPSVFCAYRMQNAKSQQFLEALGREVKRHPALSSTDVRVTHGKTEPGERWPKTIRDRIEKARAVVADMTGMRPDVVFEAGFAYGRSTPIIPVVETRESRRQVPYWLTELQTAVFTDAAGMSGVINRIVSILSEPKQARRGPPKPAPGTIVWLRTLKWQVDELEQVRRLASEEGLVLEVYPLPGDGSATAPVPEADELPAEELLPRAARANLLIISLDGSDGDSLMHFVAGAVAARPKTGADGASRLVLVLERPGYSPSEFVADSLSRVTEVVRIVSLEQVLVECRKFAERYARWANKAS